MAEWIIAVVGGKRQTQDTASPINYFCPAVSRTGCKKKKKKTSSRSYTMGLNTSGE